MSLLEDTAQILTERQEQYGHPYAEFHRVAKMWSVVIGLDVTPQQVAMCMLTLKVCRELHQHKEDNIIDIMGYAQTLATVEESIAKQASVSLDIPNRQVKLAFCVECNEPAYRDARQAEGLVFCQLHEPKE